MTQSMTGFGSAERDGYRVEIRSINHRFLEVFMRMPPYMSQLDIPFRSLLKSTFARGKIDVTITVPERAAAELKLNTELVRKIIAAFREMQDELGIRGDIDVNTLVGLHEMFIETGEKYDSETISHVFKDAVHDLAGMRIREGESLSAGISSMLDRLGEMNENVKKISSGLADSVMEKFKERLSSLLRGRDLDENRLLMEAAMVAARMDISEEIARIQSHLDQFREILAKGGIIGRKLDFIVQELNREVNTVGSKSAEYDLSSLTVEMKTELEKIREQVQNIQ